MTNIQQLAALVVQVRAHGDTLSTETAQTKLNLRIATDAIEKCASFRFSIATIAKRALSQGGAETRRDLLALLGETGGSKQ